MLSTQSKKRGFNAGWLDRDPTVAYGVAGRLGELLDPDEPLQRQARLDHRVATRAVTDRVHVRPLFGDDAPLRPQRLGDGAARLLPGHPPERAIDGDPGSLIHNVDHRQRVALADLEVVRVVRRRDLDRAGAELGIDVRIGDDGNHSADERQLDARADQMLVTRIVRVHRDPVSPSIVSTRVVATTTAPSPSPYRIETSSPSSSA